ncbi:MAG: hypothetical protein ACWA5Q_01790, partial [bacterium]
MRSIGDETTGSDFQVTRELTQLYYAQLPAALLFNLLVASAFLFAGWLELSHGYLLGWFTAIVFVTAMRFLILWRFRSQGLANLSLGVLENTAALGAFI